MYRIRISSLLTLLVALTLVCTAAAARDFVWWEGENPAETNLVSPVRMSVPGNRTPEQQAKLSGGRWLTNGKTKDGGAATIRYEVEVPKTAAFDFYVRKFWKHGPFKWRFDDDEWRICGRDIALLDNTFLEKHWGANWVALGKVELGAGMRTLQIEMLDDGGCFDCFLLIDGPFLPRGLLKPGEKTGDAMPGFFAWEPDKDPLDGSSPIDIGFLNEDVAGSDGFVRRDGEIFRLGNGEEVRFWMVQAELNNLPKAEIDRWAKRLRKNGVNLVRTGLLDFYKAYLRGSREDFAKALDKLHYVVAALKREGIYMYFGHLYWHTHIDLPKGIIPGFEGGKGIALPFLAPEFQDFYRGYAEAIFTPENPYTGVPLAKETALAFVEVNNESSLLFHTFKPSRFGDVELALAERKFGDWVARRYGSIQAGLEAWGPSANHTPDKPEEGRLGLYSAWHLTGREEAVQDRNTRRAGDQLQWMVEATLDYYARFDRMFKEEIGIGALISGSNWTTTDDRILGALERYSYTATDVVLRNGYFDTRYPKGGAQRYNAVEMNDVFGSVSGLKAPEMPGPLATPHIKGYPFMITENNWTRPNRFRAEWPVLVAGYGSLQGIDGWNFFILGTFEWQTTMGVWDLNNPTILGQFPACALIYRRGDVATPNTPAVDETISFEDAYGLKGTKIFQGRGKDALWREFLGDMEDSSTASDGIDPRAYFAGPVRHELTEGPSRVESIDLDEYIDEEAATVTSMTGELQWNFDTGVVTIDTPRAQGATGFLAAAGTITLGDVTIESKNEYGSILVVSLDGKPIAESDRLLVQAATEDKPYGFRTQTEGEYERITNLGGYPLNVKLIKATVSVDTQADEAVVLDGNGYLTDRRAETDTGGKLMRITLPENAIYTLLKQR